MQFVSNKLYLALNAALFIAYNGDEESPVAGSEIVEYCGLNKRALEPVLQKLSGAGLIVSTKGSKGGYHMPKPDKISLKDIAETFTSNITPKKHDFSGYHDVLIPAVQDGYKEWLKSLSGVTFAMLCADAREKGTLNKIKSPILNYAI